MPLVVLEGPDGSGKSTLAQKLLKGTGRPTLLIKRSGPPGDIETIDWMNQWLRYQSVTGLNVIADRHPIISEHIYRPVVRQEGPSPWTIEEVIAAFRGRAILLIYCRPPVAWLEEGVQKEEQMKGVHEHFGSLILAYDAFFMHLGDAGIPFHFYNYQNDPQSTNAIQLVREFWDHRRL
jgi:hypothetical protein